MLKIIEIEYDKLLKAGKVSERLHDSGLPYALFRIEHEHVDSKKYTAIDDDVFTLILPHYGVTLSDLYKSKKLKSHKTFCKLLEILVSKFSFCFNFGI